MNFQSWLSTFLKYDWSEHAKQHTYFDRTETNPEIIENIVRSYSTYTGGFIRERDSNRGPNAPSLLMTIAMNWRFSLSFIHHIRENWDKDIVVGMDDENKIVTLLFHNASSRLAKTLPENERDKLAEEAKLRSLENAKWDRLLLNKQD
ncbi:unnamed protein product [Rhizophagus irregularis]|uniref:Uncharacterized protein n=1 Tax=Rhizophagus irregularis TaxID=588596 RepID=A0A2N1NAC9_9GLOM|nr:hypothetical protein RhiirC2_779280 [Rhizophagus irregularis]CAB4385616.1 unnamed protein product [Rhizophagus irregularis]CAB5363733.1 unnamed protein product [Rhizophagus irregularis]